MKAWITILLFMTLSFPNAFAANSKLATAPLARYLSNLQSGNVQSFDSN